MFEHFTNSAIAVIMQAQEESRRLHIAFVGSDAILLGILKEDENLAAKVLTEAGITLASARLEFEWLIGTGKAPSPREIPFTPQVKQVFEKSFKEALNLKASFIEPEHLLLAMVDSSEDTGYLILEKLCQSSGIPISTIRARLLTKINDNPSKSAPSDSQASKDQPKRFFTKFTSQAITVIMNAQDESRRLGHNFVGAESLLLGLLNNDNSHAYKVLSYSKVDLRNARIEVEGVIGRGSGAVSVEIPFTPRAKSILEYAVSESDRLNQDYVSPDHLLLGILATDEGIGCVVIRKLGGDVSFIRSTIYAAFNSPTTHATSPPVSEAAVGKRYNNADNSEVAQAERAPFKIFLAHAKEDKPEVLKLYYLLKDRGYNPWLDKIDLLPGQNWRSEIPKAIKSSDVFIACLSTRSVRKQSYVQNEFKLALRQCANHPPDSIFVIPIRFDACEIPDLRQEDYGINLRDFHWSDYWEDGAFEDLVRSIEHVRKSKLT